MADKTRDPSHAVFGLDDTSRPAAQPGTPQAAAPSPGTPAPQYVLVQQAPGQALPTQTGGGTGLKALVVVLAVISAINLVLVLMSRSKLSDLLSKQSDQLDLLTRRMDSNDERYAQLRGQFQVTSEKLGMTEQELGRARALAADIQKKQQTAVQQLNAAISKKASSEDVNKVQAEANAKIGGVSTDLAGTKQDLEATKQALAGAKGELTGAIAKTHDELVALAHRTDRDYFEFTLGRKKAQQKVGTVMLQLEKTDIKRNTFTVNLFADDKRVQRRDKAMNEPVYFYVQGASSALELVVNKLGKDSVSGYISTPKGFFASVPNVLTARPGA